MNISTLPKYKTAGRLALLTLINLFSTFFCDAQFGVLDSTFGTNGRVTFGVAGYENQAPSVTIQPDGKILIGGDISYDQGTTYTRELLISRFNTDGSLDSTFGNAGIDTTAFLQAANGESGMTVMPNGKILVSGTDGGAMTMLRLNADGQPDSTFGVNGIVVYNVSFSSSGPILMPDRTMILGGTGYMGTGEGWEYMLMHCDSSGTPEGTFGNNGFAAINLNNNNAYCSAIAVQCDGKIVAAGSSTLSNTNFQFTILRYNADGSIDNSFGNHGIVLTTFPHTIESNAICLGLHDDGRITVAGYLVESDTFSLGLAQYLNDGSLDPSFGNGGILETNFPSGHAIPNTIIIQSDQKILIGGGSGGDASTNNMHFAMARFNKDGTPDNTFGVNGFAENYSFGTATGLAMQPDGMIVQVGYTQWPVSSVQNIVLARFSSGQNSWPVDTCHYPSFQYSDSPDGLVEVGPNPSNGRVNLEFLLAAPESVNIEIYNLLGRLVETSNISVEAGLSYSPFDFSFLPLGDYLLRAKIGSQKYSKKLIKTE